MILAASYWQPIGEGKKLSITYDRFNPMASISRQRDVASEVWNKGPPTMAIPTPTINDHDQAGEDERITRSPEQQPNRWKTHSVCLCFSTPRIPME